MAATRAAGRPIHNLTSPQISKEDFARQIARTDGITEDWEAGKIYLDMTCLTHPPV